MYREKVLVCGTERPSHPLPLPRSVTEPDACSLLVSELGLLTFQVTIVSDPHLLHADLNPAQNLSAASDSDLG
jgi:hypothetical protein